MDDYPRNMIDFRNRFITDDSCAAYLAELRWPDGFVCPDCGTGGWEMSRGLFLCRGCRRQVSVTSGTIFHGSRKPLRLWFEAMWHVTEQKYGANALGLQRILGLGSYHTAWRWLHRLRRAMVRPGRDCLRGTVEVDETYIGSAKPGKPGRSTEGKAIVAVAVEDTSVPGVTRRGMGRIRLARLPDASSASLCAFLEANVSPGSRVRTDGWSGYAPMPADAYTHDIAESADLVICHLVASLLKRWLLGTYHGAVKRHQLDYYLDEYTFRFNRRRSASRGKLFYRLVQQAVCVGPIPGRTIIGGRQEQE